MCLTRQLWQVLKSWLRAHCVVEVFRRTSVQQDSNDIPLLFLVLVREISCTAKSISIILFCMTKPVESSERICLLSGRPFLFKPNLATLLASALVLLGTRGPRTGIHNVVSSVATMSSSGARGDPVAWPQVVS